MTLDTHHAHETVGSSSQGRSGSSRPPVGDISSHSPRQLQGAPSLAHPVPAGYLVDLQEAVHLAALVLLLLHLLAEALSPTLLNGVWVLEGPAPTAVCFPHVFASITAPVEKARRDESAATVPWGAKQSYSACSGRQCERP